MTLVSMKWVVAVAVMAVLCSERFRVRQRLQLAVCLFRQRKRTMFAAVAAAMAAIVPAGEGEGTGASLMARGETWQGAAGGETLAKAEG
jgi:hypothetical protein